MNKKGWTYEQVPRVPDGGEVVDADFVQALVKYYGGRKVARIYEHRDTYNRDSKTYEIELFPASDTFFAEDYHHAKMIADTYFTVAYARRVYGFGD